MNLYLDRGEGGEGEGGRLPVQHGGVPRHNVNGVRRRDVAEDVAAHVGAGDVLDGRVGVAVGRGAVVGGNAHAVEGALREGGGGKGEGEGGSYVDVGVGCCQLKGREASGEGELHLVELCVPRSGTCR